jgi:streptomycin 6-kinase
MLDVAFPLPSSLVWAVTRQGHGWWLATLPATVAVLRDRWSLSLGPPFDPGGQTAWVAPARDRAGTDLVLKVGWRHPEADYEADGLRAWDGDGAVRLHAAEVSDHTTALLLERCRPGTPLSACPEAEQDVVIAGLLAQLWRTPPPGYRFPSLQAMCAMWADEFDRKVADNPDQIDPGLAREGIALFRALPATAERVVLLCTDLHAGNVLAARRQPWLTIDPKPHLGDPAYDGLQHLLNCEERLHADPRSLAQRMAALLGVDQDRFLLWLFARCVQEAPDSPELAEVARRIAPV